jgi:threonine dehydrogenase-like Zn-dependent dehydrogenase
MRVEGMSAHRIVFGEGGAELREYTLPALRPKEMLVRTRCSLVSVGTESTLYVSRRWNPAPEGGAAGAADGTEDRWDFEDYGSGETWDMERNRRFPGYALAGDVIAAGEEVAGYAVGDRVVALHHHADLAICPALPFITLRIPDGVSYEDATFCVLASVSMHALHRGELRIGEDVVVMGAGLVGLLATQLARIGGAHPVIAVDLSPRRLELARRMGADATIDPKREDLVRRVRECVGGEGAHLTIEAVGNPAVLQQCMRVCAPGARVVVMGAIVGTVTLDLYSEFVFRELTLIGSQQPRNPVVDSIYYHRTGQANRKALLDMIARGTLEVHQLITHRLSWREAPEVYRALGQAKNADYDGSGDVHRDLVGVIFDWTR